MVASHLSYGCGRRRLWLELLESRRVLAGNGPPNVLSITRLDANPTSQLQVRIEYCLTKQCRPACGRDGLRAGAWWVGPGWQRTVSERNWR